MKFDDEMKDEIGAIAQKLLDEGVSHYRDSEDMSDLYFELYGTIRALKLELGAGQVWTQQLDGLHLIPVHDTAGHLCILISMEDVLNLCVGSPLPEVIAYREKPLRVVKAFLAHGWYDPTTNHEPPSGSELEALEHREAVRAIMDDLFVHGSKAPDSREVFQSLLDQLDDDMQDGGDLDHTNGDERAMN